MAKFDVAKEFRLRPAVRRTRRGAIKKKIPEELPYGIGAVYAIGPEDGPFIKIGMSTKPSYRMSQLQTICPDELFMVAQIWVPKDKMSKVERRAHILLDGDGHSGLGEWFEVSHDKAMSVLLQAAGDCGVDILKQIGLPYAEGKTKSFRELDSYNEIGYQAALARRSKTLA